MGYDKKLCPDYVPAPFCSWDIHKVEEDIVQNIVQNTFEIKVIFLAVT